MVARAKRDTIPDPITGPMLGRELHAVRQELRMLTISVWGLAAGLLLIEFGA